MFFSKDSNHERSWWYYVGWALYKESINEYTRDWMLFFFKQTNKLLKWCLPRYEAVYGPMEDPKAAPEGWKE